MTPEPLECARPFPERANGHGVNAIKHLAALPSNIHETDFLEHFEVLGNGRLFHFQGIDDFADGALLEGEVIEDVAATRFGDGVEGVGSCSSPWHGSNIFPYRNMSSAIFGWALFLGGPSKTSILSRRFSCPHEPFPGVSLFCWSGSAYRRSLLLQILGLERFMTPLGRRLLERSCTCSPPAEHTSTRRRLQK